MRRHLQYFVASAILVWTLGQVPTWTHAQTAVPQAIDRPVPIEWRAPLEQFLRDLHFSGIELLIATTKTGHIGGALQPDSIVFRIEDRATCFRNSCLTVIGRIVADKFVADVMFVAGNRVTWGDHFQRLFGFQALPLWFEGDNSTVALFETPRGWLVVPQNK